MNIFKRANRVYVRYTSEGMVATVRTNDRNEEYFSDDIKVVKRENGDILTDSEIAELIRELKAKGLNVVHQKLIQP